MTIKKFMKLNMVVATIFGNYHIRAQDIGLEYDTEWQTDFKGHYNWVNLLKTSANIPVTSTLSLQGSTISVARTAQEPIVDDLQGYSNIEEENLALGIAVLGAELNISRSTIFVGIRNVNEDYFTSPVTSFFLNSSCGIFPTLSANYDIANYPLSSWCVHYKAELDKFVVQSSLYEGRGHRRITGHDNIFTISPSRNGVFSITSAEYINNGSNYNVGCAVDYGMRDSDEIGVENMEAESPSPSSPKKKRVTFAPWVNVEQRLTDKSSLLVQASYATSDLDCHYYLGLGATYDFGKAQIGALVDYAHYKECSEIAAEVSCQIPLTPIITLQPTVEVIHTGSRTNVVALGRVSIRL